MRMRHLIATVLLLALAGFPADAGAQATSSAVTVQRVVVPAVYTPGQIISVTVTLQKDDARTVQALVLQETVPSAWTYQSVSSTNPRMTPIKGQDVTNATGTKTLSFYYIDIPDFPISFTYRMTTGADDAGAITVSGLAKFRFAGAEEQSASVATPLVATMTPEGETPTEGETATSTGCTGCSQGTKGVGTALGDLFASGLALLTLLAVAHRHE